jgi:geranylgeranyl reductase family protein
MDADCTFDVVIVGTGPAGGCLAYLLAGRGIRTLLLEKKKLPRYKACGGGLTPRAARLLPFDPGALIEDEATTARLFVNGATAFARTYPQAVVRMVMRDRLDALLVEKAVARGARLLQETRFLSAASGPDGFDIQTSGGVLRARCLVGADGVHSRVARQLGLSVRYRTMTALEAELETGDPRLLDRFRHAFDFDFGDIAHGYGWVFPKRRHLSAGILTRRPRARTILRDFRRYLARKGLAGARIASLKLHPIPYAPRATNFYAAPAGLVVGDATGMVDPITGEGIYYALRTARLAADALRAHLESRAALTAYNAALQRTVGRELRYAARLADALYRLPWLSYPLLTRFGDRIGGKLMEVYEGALGYPALFRYVVGLRGLRHLLARPGRARPQAS